MVEENTYSMENNMSNKNTNVMTNFVSLHRLYFFFVSIKQDYSTQFIYFHILWHFKIFATILAPCCKSAQTQLIAESLQSPKDLSTTSILSLHLSLCFSLTVMHLIRSYKKLDPKILVSKVIIKPKCFIKSRLYWINLQERNFLICIILHSNIYLTIWIGYLYLAFKIYLL